MRFYTKQELIAEFRRIFAGGPYKSVKSTLNFRNDGAVGNTLESLIGIKENNLPLPNANEWELKGQRSHTQSLVTLKHIEPSPVVAKIVPNLLLPYYGWPHKLAGKKYPANEMSFRSTTNAVNYTKRGFKLLVDREMEKVRFVFDATKADCSDPEIAEWLKSVEKRIGLGPLNPEPYWGFSDLEHAIGSKIRNCFYVVADSEVRNKREFFKFARLYILSGFSFDKFLRCLESGIVVVDFDARTGHNHGTKFRIKQDCWANLYDSVEQAI